jgi:hypothetical protein
VFSRRSPELHPVEGGGVFFVNNVTTRWPIRMTELTRRRMNDRKVDVWHVYFGDVQVGSIGMRSGVPNDVDQWSWTCGFVSQRLKISGTPVPSPLFSRRILADRYHFILDFS